MGRNFKFSLCLNGTSEVHNELRHESFVEPHGKVEIFNKVSNKAVEAYLSFQKVRR